MPTVAITESWLKRNAADELAGKEAVLPAGASRARYFDASLPGFGVVIGQRFATFIARARVDEINPKTGKPKRRDMHIGVWGRPGARDRKDPPTEKGKIWTESRARDAAMRMLGQVSGGVDPVTTKYSGGVTLRDGMKLHLTNMREGRNRRRRACSPRSIHKIETEVPRHLADWLDRPIVDLTAAELEKICNRIRANTPKMAGAVNEPGVAQANKVIAHVSAIWNALDRSTLCPNGLPGSNPAKRYQQSALKAREERIDDAGFVGWYGKVMAMENPVRRDLQRVSLFSAIRSDGLCHLRWTDLDFDDDLIHVARAKGDRPYTVPMVETVREILEKRRADNATRFKAWGGDHGFVFPSISRDGERVIAVAEPKERRTDKRQVDDEGNPMRVRHLPGIHANRRTYNSVAIEIGVPPEARLVLMNHEGRGVNVKHYGRPQNWDYIRGEAERIEAALLERLHGKRAPRGRRKLRAA